MQVTLVDSFLLLLFPFFIPNFRGLNDCLQANGLSGVTLHDKSVYRSNPRFWETRPLTKEMLERAAEDTGALVALAQIQKKKASLFVAKEAESCSLQRTQIWKLLCFEELKPQQIGLFIGKKGANLKLWNVPQEWS